MSILPTLKNSLALAGALVATAHAHGLVIGFTTDGTWNQGFILDYYYKKIQTGDYQATPGWYEEATDEGFVSPKDYATPDIVCHKNGNNNKTTTGTVTAGGTVEFKWNKWPDTHVGPILTYIASCGTQQCNQVDKTTLKWAKIDEAAIDLHTGKWPQEKLKANNLTWPVKVPPTLAAGNYVFRHEQIAMHGAPQENGAQNYPFCVNIAVTGGGSDHPEGVLGTSLYTSKDPGIMFNPFSTMTEYKIPGPVLYTGASTAATPPGGSTPTQPQTTPVPSYSPAPVGGGGNNGVGSGTQPSPVSSPNGSPGGWTDGAQNLVPTPVPSVKPNCKRRRRRQTRDVKQNPNHT